MKTINTGSFAFAATMFVALSATADIKYWDNPAYRAYDVDCYVQNGLVLNYDGIRNAGPTADHDPDATTWKNLGTGGSTYDMAKGGTAANSGWIDGNGFHFAGDAFFKSGSKQALSEYYEIQTLVDAKASDASGIGYIYTRVFADTWVNSDTAWNGSSIAVRPEWSQTVSGTTYKGSLVFNTHYYSNGRPMVPTSSATTYDYITALGDSKSAALFTALEVPTAMPGRASPQAGSWNARNASYIYLGAHDNGSGVGEALKGTVKNFRYYSRILDADERAWNRVVDEARYFNRSAPLPVTNVVVASNIPIVSGEEPAGCYAVDGSHTFTAPASKVVKGRNYTLDGFTVETWNDATGTWGEPVSHPGESSCAATGTSRFRLVWQWTPGDGLIAYDADDYIQDGLVLHYDGIRNAGLDAPHDSAATTWVNVANPGTGDLARYSLVSSAWQEGLATGSWTNNGFVFSKNALFRYADSFTVPTRYTTQAVLEAKQSEQENIAYIVCPSPDGNSSDWLRWSVGLRKTSFDYGDGSVVNVLFYCAADAAGGRLAERGSADRVYNYATAMLDVTNAVVFTGTTAPWTATGASYGHRVKTGSGSARTLTKGFSLAGHYSTTTELLKGTIHDFRFYDRVLSDAEVAWNRVVDEARYFTEPCVVVASTRADVQANEADGEYGVSGSYTFTAPESVTVGRITYTPAGYAIQQWDDTTGCWGAATEYTGASYAYTTAAGKVRLLWRWKAVSGIRTAADYDVSDYVAGGLTFHLDGIRNAGAAEEHDSNATTWVNIGTDGEARNATVTKADDLAWTANGYTFDGTRKFLVSNATGLGTASHTVQLLTDAVQNNQQNPSGATIYFFSGVADWFAGATYSGSYYYRIQGNGNDLNLRFTFDKDAPIGYATLMTDASAKKAYAFQGESKSNAEPNVKSYDSISAPSFGNLAIGGWGGAESQYMKGTINYFRYYDRVLSDAELAHNREVDEARYFDALTVTNVVVQTKFASIAGEEEVLAEEPGAYKVEGEWTFSATKVKDKEGVLKDVAGYYTEELNADGTWTRKTWHDGTSYTYHAETLQGKTIRLTWCTNRKGLLVIMR